MPEFLYQILPADGSDEPEYYQISQEEGDAPIATHPHTGVAWERVLNDDGTPVIVPESGHCGCGDEDCHAH